MQSISIQSKSSSWSEWMIEPLLVIYLNCLCQLDPYWPDGFILFKSNGSSANCYYSAFHHDDIKWIEFVVKVICFHVLGQSATGVVAAIITSIAKCLTVGASSCMSSRKLTKRIYCSLATNKCILLDYTEGLALIKAVDETKYYLHGLVLELLVATSNQSSTINIWSMD